MDERMEATPSIIAVISEKRRLAPARVVVEGHSIATVHRSKITTSSYTLMGMQRLCSGTETPSLSVRGARGRLD